MAANEPAAGRLGGSGPEGAGALHAFVGSTDGTLRAFNVDGNGELEPAGSASAGDDLDFLAVGPDDRTVFVSRNQWVAAFRYDPEADAFAPLGQQSTGGRGTHVAAAPTGARVLVASYQEGALSLLEFSKSSGFGAARVISPGQNAHQVLFGTAGTRVYVPCLGSDYVAQYDLDPAGAALVPASPPTVAAPGGPRHMALHPSGRIAYVLAENSSQVHVFDVDDSGSLVARPGESRYTSADSQYHWSSDIHVTPNGEHVYAVNRRPPELVHFTVGERGVLQRRESTALDGVVRSFAVEPGGRFLLIGGESGNLRAFGIDAAGALSPGPSTPGLGDVHATVLRALR